MTDAPAPTRALLGWLALAAALYGLNLALSFHNVWPTLLVEDRHEISIEIALLVLALGLVAEWRGPPGERALRWTTTLLLALVVGRYAEVTAPALFGRAINLYWDAQHLPAVVAMLARAAPTWQSVLAALGVAALLAAAWLALRWCLARVWRALHRPLARRLLTALAGVLVLVYHGAHLGLPSRPAGWYSLPVTATYAEQARFLAIALAGDAVADPLPPSPPIASDLARVRDTDVFIVFVESYGAVAYDDPAFDAHLAPHPRAQSGALRAGRREVVSAYVRAPTTGGGSWLSHASLLAGVEVRDQGRYALLLTRHRDTLVSRFAEAGHRTLGLMPGMRGAWPEGAFYRFEQLYDAAALDYRGPAFAWWRIPDQYALARLREAELAGAERAPRLVVFPTISSHMPFRPTPPYQPDWRRLLGEQPFDPAAAAAALLSSPEWTDLGPGYAESIAYAHEWLAGWLRAPSAKPLLAVILGDHQPPAAVAGPGAPWEVPVHVVSEDAALLAALEEAGFVRGLEPARPALGEMHELHARLLRVLDGAAATPADTAPGSLPTGAAADAPAPSAQPPRPRTSQVSQALKASQNSRLR